MTENPFPSPQTAVPPPPAGVVTPTVNGAPPAAEPASPRVSLQNVLQYYAINAALLAALWVAAYFVLSMSNYEPRDAVGFAIVITLVGSFFTRSLIPQLAEKAKPSTTQPQQVDSAREIIETVVFVVVLVLLLKSYAAEAFVIPTGSMAETLWGYQKVVECPQCGYKFPVNCSSEVDPSDGSMPQVVTGCTCPNCRQDINLWRPPMDNPNIPMPADAGNVRDPGWRSGDRVLVGKFAYDLLDRQPDRLDVVVFRFPGERDFPLSGPVKKHVPMNYIKRLDGLPGETVALHRGKLWVLSPEKSPKWDDYEKAKADPGALAQLWRREYMHSNDPRSLELFQTGEYAIVRKKAENLLTMRRIVYDNDHQARDLLKDKAESNKRWSPDDNGWAASGATAFQCEGNGGSTAWLRYRHLLRSRDGKPQLITDFMGYNTWQPHQVPAENWASDLMIECEVKVEKPDGTFVLELSRGTHRYQASFDLKTGTCTLFDLENNRPTRSMGEAATALKAGSHTVRFANVDDRLVVWVDDKLPFGEGVTYGPVRNLEPTRENDLDRPASLGSTGAKVTVSKIKLFRDTYYTTAQGDMPSRADVNGFEADNPSTFSKWAEAPVSTFYVQPGHFLCLGDNSPESSDGRTWGLVPQRLLLGRALLVYYPFSRAGRIR